MSDTEQNVTTALSFLRSLAVQKGEQIKTVINPDLTGEKGIAFSAGDYAIEITVAPVEKITFFFDGKEENADIWFYLIDQTIEPGETF